MQLGQLGLGGGCHWCTEGVFQALIGVEYVEQGWISSETPYESFSEAIIVHFNPQLIELEMLIEIHLQTHSSQSNHPFRSKYRSAIYYYSESQGKKIEAILNVQNEEVDPKYITKVLKLKDFKLNKEEYLDYYQKNKEAPFCKRYIAPKLKTLLKTHSKNLDKFKMGKIDNS
ncbi:MAG: peptide methionine sulfoxide reductase [Aureispira sp.]|nr:peptide methionine sulfoxide reductase [Aureispira sp.]